MATTVDPKVGQLLDKSGNYIVHVTLMARENGRLVAGRTVHGQMLNIHPDKGRGWPTIAKFVIDTIRYYATRWGLAAGGNQEPVIITEVTYLRLAPQGAGNGPGEIRVEAEFVDV